MWIKVDDIDFGWHYIVRTQARTRQYWGAAATPR